MALFAHLSGVQIAVAHGQLQGALLRVLRSLGLLHVFPPCHPISLTKTRLFVPTLLLGVVSHSPGALGRFRSLLWESTSHLLQFGSSLQSQQLEPGQRSQAALCCFGLSFYCHCFGDCIVIIKWL